MSYKIDISGKKADVVKELTAKQYDDVVQTYRDEINLLEMLEKQSKVPKEKMQQHQEQVRAAQNRVKILSAPGEKECFERAKAYALAEIAATKSAKIGVSIHASDHMQGMEGTIQVAVAGYSWLGESPVDMDHNDYGV